MKKLTLLLLTLFLLLFNGCGSAVKSMMIYDTDYSLHGIAKVNALPTRNSVGFEWDPIVDNRVHGVNVYRGIPTVGNQVFERIGSTNSRYATHFVDTEVHANHNYIYTFKTFSLGKESKYGAILNIKTLEHLEAIPFAKVFAVSSGAVKLLWSPHTNQSVTGYRIERAKGNGSWEYLAEVKGQLMAEYVDTFVQQGVSYSYRIFAKSYDGQWSYPSAMMSISL